MERNAWDEKELTKFLKEMELGEERTVMALDGMEDGVMPDLAMGVIKEKYFDSDTTTYLVGVYGNDTNFMSFFSGDYDNEDICIENVINWFNETGNAFCGSNFGGLYVKSTDEENEELYEENKYNGVVERTIETLDYGDVDLVSRYDVDSGETFYDCYQKEGGGYLGEFHLGGYDLDQYSDDEIDKYLEDNMQVGW